MFDMPAIIKLYEFGKKNQPILYQVVHDPSDEDTFRIELAQKAKRENNDFIYVRECQLGKTNKAILTRNGDFIDVD